MGKTWTELMRSKGRLMTSYTTKRCFGDNDLSPSSFPRVTRTQSIFTNRPANGAGKIPLRACMIQRVWCTNTREIATIAEAFYKGLLTASMDLSMESVLALVDNVIT